MAIRYARRRLGIALVAGDKVYICDEDGELSIINTGTEFNSAEVEEIEFPTSIYATPVAVGTTLYIATRSASMPSRIHPPSRSKSSTSQSRRAPATSA
ncbi:MAG: hypothetical protein R3F11_20285 [Verrucomicrobiales bacterium]